MRTLYIIKIERTNFAVFSAIALIYRIVNRLQDFNNVFVAYLNDVRYCPFGRFLLKQSFYVFFTDIAVGVS